MALNALKLFNRLSQGFYPEVHIFHAQSQTASAAVGDFSFTFFKNLYSVLHHILLYQMMDKLFSSSLLYMPVGARGRHNVFSFID